MQNRIVLSIGALTAGLAFSSVAFGQTELAPPGWKTCPHCLTPKQQREIDATVTKPGLPFNPRDFSGVWNTRPDRAGVDIIETVHDAFAKDQNSTGVPPKNLPPMTPYGRKLFDATLTDFKAPEGTRVTNSKDPMLKCDPLGWPRWFGYNYGIEFVMLPDRILHFIEWAHTWRTIWMDGRKLPENVPEPRFLGWAVGHWEADNTLVIESTGYDERSWISEAGNFITKPGSKGWGLNAWPHSDEMRITERWKRTSYGILEAQLTVIDPKVYTKPWTTDIVKHTFLPNTELWEYFCVPSDSEYFNEKVVRPSNGAK
jgi:hypothetical protein